MYDPSSSELELARHEATHDPLTRLLNRRGLEEEFNGLCERIPGNFSAVCVDLDNLKVINDRGGHTAGDEILVRSADILEHTMRHQRDEPDIPTAARVGGDEFVVLLPKTVNQEQIAGYIERLRLNLAAEGIGASIGGSAHKKDQNLTMLIKNADVEVYKDKRERKEEKYKTLARRKKIASYIGSRLVRYAGMYPPR